MTERMVVLLCGPSGAGKTTAARGSGLKVYDFDDPEWVTHPQFLAAIAALAKQPDARAVVIRAAPTSAARAELAKMMRATHTYLIVEDHDTLVSRIRHRGRADAVGTIAGLDSWFARHERWDGVAEFPGWPTVMGDQLDLGLMS